MNPTQQVQAFAQSVYLRIKNRQYDDITSVDGQAFVANVIDFANGFLDELETETNPAGQPMDWKWSTRIGFTLGTAIVNTSNIILPKTIDNVIDDENRYIQVAYDNIVVSNWLLVSPDQITNGQDRVVEDRCTVTGNILTFSRLFKDYENGGIITGDVTVPIPRLTLTNAAALNIVKPRELFVLGVAKNSSLPDIVKGNLSPSYVQKYEKLLANTIARNNSSGAAETAHRSDYGSIRGIY
jgi:hypothetical protein